MLLGDRIIGIEHIGSTSIKGLEAKPIIDIIVGVEDLDEVSSFLPLLVKSILNMFINLSLYIDVFLGKDYGDRVLVICIFVKLTAVSGLKNYCFEIILDYPSI
ncbi:hypothetical protein EYB33_07040 [Lysinibacillus sphaericus]|nr:GrpB family protein [Lysinibacillus sphaericus]MCS1382705.1 GrpB family protein [Lysinibacillus sphaericus]UDK96057.1 hypothetical protein EYB33_07040 [Lysinibacillus sphaericus]